jgi:phosphatidylserine/phosphatidylglycerophosphate/cardiolipin synthase-like enzyme
MWTAVGGGLLFFGARWATGDRLTLAGTGLLLAGVAAGVMKSRLVLDRTATKILSRIASRGEGRCVGGFLSVRSWLLVLGMILLGRVRRYRRGAPHFEPDCLAGLVQRGRGFVKIVAGARQYRIYLLIFCLWLAAVGVFHVFKTLPPGIDYRGREHLVPARDIEFLADLTYEDPEGAVLHRQEIFDTIFTHIDRADKSILVDMFLFNSFTGSGGEIFRDLSGELTRRLVTKKEQSPRTRIHVVTDPINTVYGGVPSPEIDSLREGGIDVILTNLRNLRDSNPAYSSFWRTFVQWFGNSDGGGVLPHPFSDRESGVSLRSYLEMLNFKANHRKVFVADSAGGAVTIVSSANPHDASSAHSNVAFLIRNGPWGDVYETEGAVARLSGGDILRPAPPGGEDYTPPETAKVVVVTERRIKEEVLDALMASGAGDRVWLAMFYLSDRDVLGGLLEASARGAEVKLILDPNRDAFGFEKSGIPNRQTAGELREKSGGAIAVRWYKTHGEQFHAKLVFVDRGNGEATAILGSANLTRRNLDGFNLELDVSVTADGSRPPMTDIRDYLEMLWENRDGTFTVDYEEFDDDSFVRAAVYRFQEFSGLCSY